MVGVTLADFYSVTSVNEPWNTLLEHLSRNWTPLVTNFVKNYHINDDTKHMSSSALTYNP